MNNGDYEFENTYMKNAGLRLWAFNRVVFVCGLLSIVHWIEIYNKLDSMNRWIQRLVKSRGFPHILQSNQSMQTHLP
jgi:hypothetical protein